MADEKPEETKPETPDPETSESAHFDGPHGGYTVTASTTHLRDAKGKEKATIFSVSYVLDGDDRSRPVTFCFNGGPGSSSVWLQFGAYGPKRVDLPDLEIAPPAGCGLVDNEHSILDLTDLVFIDPVGTGFSKAQGETEDKAFHNVDSDVESVAEFIWRWLSNNGRWASPKYISGESYGTTRCGGLALKLQELGIQLTGAILVSLAMDFQTIIFAPANDLPNVLYLPTYAALAHYHGRIEVDDLDAFLDEARRFAVEEYGPALMLGSRLTEERKAALAGKLAALTGLDADEIAARQLRIDYLWFARTLLGAGDKTIGRLDGRYVGRDLMPQGRSLTRDPSYDAAIGAYTAATNDFLRREVGWDTSSPYNVLSLAVNQGWSFERKQRLGYVNTAEDLRQAMVANPHLKVLFANGLYDLATPFFAAEFTRDHLSVDTDLAGQIVSTYYPAGHMMYFHPPSLAQLKADLASFYAG
ncbi:MAG: peptidase S10 [Deltaproteobacteria bacterium]|nr:MAG: peptidase S10 [Deltaproteobacteria bacterium]